MTSPSSSDANPPRRREVTQQRLLDAAYEAFAAKGFGRTRIDDICRGAGLTKGAFYSNFSSLDELFFALYRREAAQGATYTVDALQTANVDDIADLVTAWANGLYIDRTWLLINTDFVSYAARFPDVAEQLASERSTLRAAVTDMIAGFIAAQDIALPEHLDTPAKMARALVTVFDGATQQLLLDLTEEQVRRQFIDITLAMLSGPAA